MFSSSVADSASEEMRALRFGDESCRDPADLTTDLVTVLAEISSTWRSLESCND